MPSLERMEASPTHSFVRCRTPTAGTRSYPPALERNGHRPHTSHDVPRKAMERHRSGDQGDEWPGGGVKPEIASARVSGCGTDGTA